MKNTKRIINLIFSLCLIMIFYSCATNTVDKTKPEPKAQEPLTYPVPSSSLPKLVNNQELSFVPKQTKYEQIYVKLFLPERPEENLVDIYIYDKKAKNISVVLITVILILYRKKTLQALEFSGLRGQNRMHTT